MQAELSHLVNPDFNYQDYEYPKVSIVIPTFNNCEKISLTLDSLLGQHYPDFEIIVIDSGSTDRTLEVVKNYRDERISIYSVLGCQRYEMLNKGIAHSTGEYVNCLFPGDYYILPETLLYMMKIALDHNKTELVFCGTLLRDGRTDPKILLRPFSLDLLKKGQQPTSLQSCWFKIETLRNLGKFNTDYTLRGGYELMCRFLLDSERRHIFTSRILTDYDLRHVTRTMVVSHFTETFSTIWRYFGVWSSLNWLLIQKDFDRILKIWWRQLTAAFTGR